jgi:hypothetical protein
MEQQSAQLQPIPVQAMHCKTEFTVLRLRPKRQYGIFDIFT